MKKVFVFMALCIATLLLIPGAVYAADAEPDVGTIVQSGQTIVKYGLDAYYQIEVPVDLTLSMGRKIYDEVEVQNCLLDYGDMVVVNVTSNSYSDVGTHGYWNMLNEDDPSYKLSYHIHIVKEGIDSSGNVTYTNEGPVMKDVPFMKACFINFADNPHCVEVVDLEFYLPEQKEPVSGNYKDVLTFNAEIKPCDIAEHNHPVPLP